ncbi:hypothetical protein BGX27_004045 [Mortierella sp. AM989]|nr:hypothetical protein BGX27_004045 [Mortierella sp. AM989]
MYKERRGRSGYENHALLVEQSKHVLESRQCLHKDDDGTLPINAWPKDLSDRSVIPTQEAIPSSDPAKSAGSPASALTTTSTPLPLEAQPIMSLPNQSSYINVQVVVNLTERIQALDIDMGELLEAQKSLRALAYDLDKQLVDLTNVAFGICNQK